MTRRKAAIRRLVAVLISNPESTMLRTELIEFIQHNILRDPNAMVAPEESLIDRGLLDSMTLMRILQLLEARTGTRIPDALVTPDNFESIVAIERMVDQLRKDATATG